jgi:quercetin dioxygenase-like cupin family protein
MKKHMLLTVTILAVSTLAAQQTAFKRTILQQSDISIPGREAITGVGEFQPGAVAGRHTHAGEEIGYVLEGTVIVEIDGKLPLTLGPGKTFIIPAGTVHNARNPGNGIAKVLATYIVEKGKPLATPVAGK